MSFTYRPGKSSTKIRQSLRHHRRTLSIERLESRCLLAASSYTWQNVAIGAGGFVDGVFYDQHNQNVIYARTDIGGLYKTTNDGQSWTQLLDFVGNSTGTSGNGTQSQLIGVLSFAIDPQNSNNLYADVGEYLGINGAVFYSTDAGQTWAKTNLNFYVGGNSNGRAFGEQIAVDPNNSNIIYLGTNDHGLYKSTDSGHSFSPVASFSPTSTTFVLFDPAGTPGNPSQTIYVGANATGSGTNLYVTTTGGTSWSQISGTGTLPSGWMPGRAALSGGNLYLGYSNALLPNNQSSAGGFFRYTTSTGVWANISPSGISNAAFVGVAADPNNPNTVVVSTFDRYSDRDLMWRTLNANAASPTWYQLFDPSSAQNFGYDGFNTTRNYSGAAYTAAFGDGTGNWAGSIAINPFNSDQLMYGTGLGIWATDNVSNGGTNTKLTGVNNWYFPNYGIEFTNADWVATSSVGTPLYSTEWDINGFAHTTLAQSPANGAIVPTNAAIGSSILGSMTSIDAAGTIAAAVGGVGTNFGVYSLDDGITWSAFAARPAGTATNGTIAVNTTGGTNMTLVWVGSGMAPYYSTNNGATWTASSGTFVTGGTVIADRNNPNDFYYFAGTGAWFSNNGGVSFTLESTHAPTNGRIAVNPFTTGDLWIMTSGGLYHSSNFGATFAQVSTITNSSANNSVGGLALGAPAPGQTNPAIYVFGTLNGFLGIYRSDDGGSSWTQVNDVNHQWGGLVQYMAADPNVFGRVYLAVNGRGVIMGNPASSLPAGWSDADVNSPGNPGWSTSSITLSNGTTINQWNVIGGGVGISGSTFSVSSLTSSIKVTGQRIATVVITTANGLDVGDRVTIAGATPSGYNGTYQVSSIINATTFTYVVTPNLGAASGTITASTNDQFNFAIKPITGGASISAQLLSMTNANGVALGGANGAPQAGVMFRAGTTAGDVYAAILQTTGNQLVFQYRTTSGGSVTSVSLGSIPVGGEYVELTRSGNNFSAYYSADGINWTQLGSTIAIASMPATANVGLAASANFNAQLTSAKFANVVIHLQGDINLDGHVNAADIGVLMQALTDSNSYQSTYHLSPTEAAFITDVNGDGTANNADLQNLLSRLISGGGSSAQNENTPSGESNASQPMVPTLIPSLVINASSDSASTVINSDSSTTNSLTPTNTAADNHRFILQEISGRNSAQDSKSTSPATAGNFASTSKAISPSRTSIAMIDHFFARIDRHPDLRVKSHRSTSSHHQADDQWLTDSWMEPLPEFTARS